MLGLEISMTIDMADIVVVTLGREMMGDT